MSAHETEAPAAAAKPANSSKLLTILAAAGVAFSLIAVILLAMLLMRPVASKIEEGNAEIKEALDASRGSLEKKVEALRDACIDWQAVLKVAGEKPDATFRIVKTPDGLLTLAEINQGAAESAPADEHRK